MLAHPGGTGGGTSPKTLAVVGVIAVGGFILFFLSKSSSTSSSSGVDPNSVVAQNAILAANSNALAVGADERVKLATIAAGLSENTNNNSTSLAVAHDNNQTTLAVAQQQGASRAQLAQIAAASTYQSALLDTVKSVESTLSTAQTAQYHDYVTGASKPTGGDGGHEPSLNQGQFGNNDRFVSIAGRPGARVSGNRCPCRDRGHASQRAGIGIAESSASCRNRLE